MPSQIFCIVGMAKEPRRSKSGDLEFERPNFTPGAKRNRAPGASEVEWKNWKNARFCGSKAVIHGFDRDQALAKNGWWSQIW
jgi:hypothetical protein